MASKPGPKQNDPPTASNDYSNIDLSTLPHIIDQSAETITDNVHTINEQTKDERLKFVMKSLVTHLHDFAREVHLQSDEWMAALNFLARTGQITTPIRHEFMLLSDVLGLSLLVDALSHPKPEGCTESTVLGPFHTEDAEDVANGESIASEGKGQYCYVSGRVTNTKGEPIEGAELTVWETDEKGFYDTQYSDRSGPDCRGVIHSDKDGFYFFRAVVPVPYPIPGDGPVGDLLELLNRHKFRPSHLHFRVKTPGYEELITAVYRKGDPFETSDAVFGVKSSLVQDFPKVDDEAEARKLGFKNAPFWRIDRDFILASVEEGQELRRKEAAAKGAPL